MVNLNNYECKNQLDIFDYLKSKEAPPERCNKVKVGEIIYFVGYGVYQDYEDNLHRDFGKYRAKVTEVIGNSFKAYWHNSYVWLDMKDFKKRFFYMEEEAEKKRVEYMNTEGSIFYIYDGIYLATKECREAIKQSKENWRIYNVWNTVKCM